MITFTGTIENPAQFRISTTTIDGRGRAFLYCVPCHEYAYNVSSRDGVSDRIADVFSDAALDVILASVATHECPPKVNEYARRKGITS